MTVNILTVNIIMASHLCYLLGQAQWGRLTWKVVGDNKKVELALMAPTSQTKNKLVLH